MIKYRPHRATLAEALEEAKEFNNIDEMFDYIVSQYNGIVDCFSKEDLIVKENRGEDRRCNWKETRYICTKRMGNEIYDVPQCIGMCSIEK